MIDDLDKLFVDWLVGYWDCWVGYFEGYDCYTYNQLLLSVT